MADKEKKDAPVTPEPKEEPKSLEQELMEMTLPELRARYQTDLNIIAAQLAQVEALKAKMNVLSGAIQTIDLMIKREEKQKHGNGQRDVKCSGEQNADQQGG